VASRWGNILQFQNFDLLTPNEREARFALADQDSTVRPLATELFNRANCKMLILKLGERGVITCRAGDSNVRSFFSIDSFVDRLVDAVGAGDALLAYATLAMARTKCHVIASVLGSISAALACEQDGNVPVEPEKVLARLEVIRKKWHFEA
jgi:sugar/nucleoside kinase (ribokinase family)